MLQISLDWIEWTTIQFMEVESCLHFLGLQRSEFIFCDHSRYGYKSMLKHSEADIYILFDGRDDMGIHLSCAGHSVNFFKFCTGFDDLHLLTYLSSAGHFTRIDLALDDIGAEYFNIPTLKRYLVGGKYVGKFRDYSFISMYESGPERKKGDTIYLGRRSSGVFFRIYDKRLEHDFKLPNEAPQTFDQVRWEMETKGQHADNLVKEIIKNENIGFTYFSVLVNYFRIIKLDASRRSRCSMLPKYEEFTNGIPAAKIVNSSKILEIDRKKAWLLKSCSKSIALCNISDPDFMDMLDSFGYENLSDDDLKAV